MLREVKTWYVEMLSPEALRATVAPSADARIEVVSPPAPELNRDLYRAVGQPWYWIDRLQWSETDWHTYVRRRQLETLVLYAGEQPAGYVELEQQPEGDVEIVYFGLKESFIGRGLGGFLLSAGVQRAWESGAKRVWLHTCSLDSPNALPNYIARGFRIYDQKTEQVTLPELSVD